MMDLTTANRVLTEAENNTPELAAEMKAAYYGREWGGKKSGCDYDTFRRTYESHPELVEAIVVMR